MKVATHAKQQTQRSHEALLAHAAMAEKIITDPKRARDYVRALAFDGMNWRPMFWRLLPDHSVEPIKCRPDDPEGALEGARTMEGTRRVAETDVEGFRVSTVFLGLDHSWSGGPPLIFESMVFSATTKFNEIAQREFHEELDQRRYSTYAQAMAGHEAMVAETRAFVAGLNKMKGTSDDAN